MEKLLQEKLNPGENLLWVGKPEEFKTLDAANKKRILGKVLVMAAVVAALAVWYLSTVSAKGEGVRVLELLAVVSPMLCAWTDFSDAIKLRKQVVYGLTDSRLLTLDGKRLISVDYENVVHYDLVTDLAGHTSLVCGDEGLKAKSNTIRELTIRGASMNVDTNHCESYAMYGVSGHAEEIKKILSAYIA